MKRLQNHLVGVDQGDAQVFSDFQNSGPMWTDSGARQAVKTVRFAEAFRVPPCVHVSLSMWDFAADSNARVEISTTRITAEGFDIVLHTWGDTRIARASASWMAIGELPHEDDWDIL